MKKQNVTRSHRAVRFTVDDVPVAKEPLSEERTHEAIGRRLNGRVEACVDYTSTVVPCETHPLVEACVRAWLDHRPLVLTPDAIWVAIAQGFAAHVNANAEALRSRLVRHDGKKKLLVDARPFGFASGSPENPWPLVFAQFGKQIEASAPGGYDLVVARFSTTGPVELAAQEVVLMDAFQAYFEYEMLVGCGLPEVVLVGEVADWELLREKARALAPYGLERWLRVLDPTLGRLVDTSKGEVDRGFWRDLVRHHAERGFYGGPRESVDGWLTQLFPYGAVDMRTGRPTGDLRLGGQRDLDDFASGLSCAPVKELSNRGEREMQFLAGFVGIEQAGVTLRPKLGWAVRPAPRPQSRP